MEKLELPDPLTINQIKELKEPVNKKKSSLSML